MKRVKIILQGLILVFASATCLVACDPEDEPVRNQPGSTETPFNATNLSLEEINDILVGTWVQTRDDPYYGRDTIDFLESGIIHETYPKYLRNHDGWNYNLTRDSIFTFISGKVWNLYEIYDCFGPDISCFMEVNTGDPDGEYFKDQYVYVLMLYKKDNEYHLVIPDWHPNPYIVGTFFEFKKIK